MSRRSILIGVVALVVIGGGFFALGGGSALTAQPTPTPTLGLEELEDLVPASGTLLPARRANLAFKIPGQVVRVQANAGDTVKMGDVLMRLDAGELEAAVAIAQANLNQLKAGPSKEEIAAAQANLDAALAQLARVRAGPTVEDVLIAKATLDRAQAGLKDAQSAYDKVRDDPAVGMFPQSQTLQAAIQQLTIAEATYNKVLKGATPEEVRIAEANVAAARAALDRVKAGARPEEIAAAEARLNQAKAGLAATALAAPFDGTVASVYVKEGEMVTPGTPVIALGDLSKLRLETDDLSETNIARVKPGQPVAVTFEALPGRTFHGTVTTIASISTPKQGGTNYTVTIEFDQLDPALRWGMTGHIEINTKQKVGS